MKKTGKIFLRSFFISSVIVICISIAVVGIGKSYESMRLIGFGEYKKAFEITDSGIRILDFEIKI